MPPSLRSAKGLELSNENSLESKTALVTGGTGRIGYEIVRALAEAGAVVTIADDDIEAGQKYAFDLTAKGLRVTFVATDVSSWRSQLNAFGECLQHSPTQSIDIVVAAALTYGPSFFRNPPFTVHDKSDEPPAPLLDDLSINLVGSYYTATLAVRSFRKTARSTKGSDDADKQLLFLTSVAAFDPIPLHPTHSMSQMGIRGLWGSLRDSPDLTGMRTNLIVSLYSPADVVGEVSSVTPDETGEPAAKETGVANTVMRIVHDSSIQGRIFQVNDQKSYVDVFVEPDQKFQAPREEKQRIMDNLRDGMKPAGQRIAKEKGRADRSSPFKVPRTTHVRPKSISRVSDQDIRQMYACLHSKSAI